MNINYQLALVVDESLKNNGVNRYLNASDENFTYFSFDQIARVKELKVVGVDSLDGLEHFHNLRRLYIISEDFNKISSDASLEGNPFVNNIKSFLPIEKLEKLEELVIMNDVRVKSLDLTKLGNLQKINFINNPNFTKLTGLDKLKKLEEVFMYGNSITSTMDIDAYMQNTLPARKNILDINMYTSIVNRDLNVAKKLSDNFIVGLTNIKFAEKSGFMDFAIIDTRNLLEMYTKLNNFFKKNKLYDEGASTKIIAVYQYLMKNVNFGYKQLEERNKMYKQLMKEHDELPDYIKKNFASLHSSYNTYHFKKGNCEGYVNLMSFMLDMLNIENYNVHCFDKRYLNYGGYTNHSMIRVKYKDKWLYCDPTYDPKNANLYFMKTYDKISETHRLNIFEKEVAGEYTHEQYNDRNIRR